MSLDTEQSQYIDNGDGTITDTYNSLMWKKADSWCDFGHLITQVQSLEYARQKNEEKFAGYNDWNVPTSQDAKTLYHEAFINTDKDGCELHIHPLFQSGGGYTTWTSETRAAKQAMGYDLRDDYEYWLDKNNDGFPSSVRIVRNVGSAKSTVITIEGKEGQQEVSRFLSNKNGTISDRKTGLMWKKTDSYLEMDKWISWQEAKIYIMELNKKAFANFKNWRMPTRKEALSIFSPQHAVTDVYGDTVYLPEEFPPGSAQTTWTKTLHKTDNALAIRVFYYNGDYKWHKVGLRSHGVRAVRTEKQE